MTDDPRRTLPSVQSVLELSGVQQLLDQAPRDLLVGAVRDAIEVARRQPDGRWLFALDMPFGAPK
jgi:hypothetical protein